MKNKKNAYRVCISIIAIIFSILAAAIGCGFVGESELTFLMKFICNFVFFMSPISVIWVVIALFTKK